METKLNTLAAAYLAHLQAAIAANPDAYFWTKPTVIHGNAGDTIIPGKTPEEFTAKMIAEAAKGNVSVDKASSPTMHAVVKALGIKPTQAALKAWLIA